MYSIYFVTTWFLVATETETITYDPVVNFKTSNDNMSQKHVKSNDTLTLQDDIVIDPTNLPEVGCSEQENLGSEDLSFSSKEANFDSRLYIYKMFKFRDDNIH